MSDERPDAEAAARGDVDPRDLLTAGLVSELITDTNRLARSIETFAQELVTMRHDVDVVSAMRRRDRVGYAIGVVTVIALVALSVFLSGSNRQVIERIETVVEEVEESEEENRESALNHRRRNEALHGCIIEYLQAVVAVDTAAERVAIPNPCVNVNGPEEP